MCGIADRAGLGAVSWSLIASGALLTGFGCSGAGAEPELESHPSEPTVEAQVVVHRARNVNATQPNPAMLPSTESFDPTDAQGLDAPEAAVKPEGPQVDGASAEGARADEAGSAQETSVTEPNPGSSATDVQTPAKSAAADEGDNTATGTVAEAADAVALREFDDVVPNEQPRNVQTSAEAMAHFVQASSVDMRLLAATGLNESVPAIGECRKPPTHGATALSNLEEIQLLEVGEVTLQALDIEPGRLISLAPQAFPSVLGFVSGVVYTSRDRSPDAFPSGATYRIEIAGTADVPATALEGQAPRELEELTLAGERIESVTEVETATPLDVTWSVGEVTDRVMVDLLDLTNGALWTRCTFADEVGAATIPQEVMAGLDGAGRVVVHRLRTIRTALDSRAASEDGFGSPAGSVQLNFDFETGVLVDFLP